MARKLPAYAKQGIPHGEMPVVHVDATAAYEAWLKELDIAAEHVDQYWLEVAYQCIKLELQVAMRGFTFEIRIHDPEKKWAQRKFPEGIGAARATFGKEARLHFMRARGGLPA